ncbi:MAG: lipoprotein-releasing ABC transporter permease subunit [Pseudomonadota bacterium]
MAPKPSSNDQASSTRHAGSARISLACELSVATRYLRARRQDGFISLVAWFSLIGIAIGVATLIIVMSVMNGFRHDLFDRILGFTGHISVTAFGEPLSDANSLRDRLVALDQVKDGRILISGSAMATSGSRAHGVLIRALAETELAKPLETTGSGLDLGLTAQAKAQFASQEGLLIGRHLYRSLRLNRGAPVTLILPEGTQTGFGTFPRIVSYPAIAPFSVGMYQYDSGVILMPIAMAQNLFKLQADEADAIELFIKDPHAASQTANIIRQMLGDGYFVRDWQESNQSLVGALEVERNVMFVILTLIILVAAFNVLSSLVMLVQEKQGNIAILLSCGVSKGSVLRIFLICGSAIGAIGSVFGVVLGVLFASNIESIRRAIESLTGGNLFREEIYFLSQLPARIELHETVLVGSIALVISILAALYPALRATRLQPIEILRHG